MCTTAIFVHQKKLNLLFLLELSEWLQIASRCNEEKRALVGGIRGLILGCGHANRGTIAPADPDSSGNGTLLIDSFTRIAGHINFWQDMYLSACWCWLNSSPLLLVQ
jgi:hypothetical protein